MLLHAAAGCYMLQHTFLCFNNLWGHLKSSIHFFIEKSLASLVLEAARLIFLDDVPRRKTILKTICVSFFNVSSLIPKSPEVSRF
jgi:hypothetical protein